MRKIHKAGIVECDECGRKVLDLKRHKEILHKLPDVSTLGKCSDQEEVPRGRSPDPELQGRIFPL